MKNILLIGTKLIKAESVIEENVDEKILSKVISNVQEVQLKDILGKDLYDLICESVKLKANNPGYQINEPYKELLVEYIQPFLVNAVVAEFIALNNYKVSNKGLQKLNDNSSSSINAEEVEYLKNYYDNFVSIYKSNLIKFLKDKNLHVKGTDTDLSFPSTGWFLGSDTNKSTSSANQNGSAGNAIETDPIWLVQKENYYTKAEVDALAASAFARHIFNEFLSGIKDGVNINFTTAYPFIPNSTQLYQNGQRLINNYDYDYYELGNQQIVFRFYSPFISDKLTIDYLTNSNI